MLRQECIEDTIFIPIPYPNTAPCISNTCGDLYACELNNENPVVEIDLDEGVNFSCEDNSSTVEVISDQNSPAVEINDNKIQLTQLGQYTVKYLCAAEPSYERVIKVVDTLKPVISLQGSEMVEYEASSDETYTDAGATCSDWVDGDISRRIKVSKEDDIILIEDFDVIPSGETFSLPDDFFEDFDLGVYTIKYECTNYYGYESSIHRTVHVKDTMPPVITLQGVDITGNGNYFLSEAGFPFEDSGATCSDTLDGDLGLPVETQDTEPGTGFYFVEPIDSQISYYICKDSSGNSTKITTIPSNDSGFDFGHVLPGFYNLQGVCDNDGDNVVDGLNLTPVVPSSNYTLQVDCPISGDLWSGDNEVPVVSFFSRGLHNNGAFKCDDTNTIRTVQIADTVCPVATAGSDLDKLYDGCDEYKCITDNKKIIFVFDQQKSDNGVDPTINLDSDNDNPDECEFIATYTCVDDICNNVQVNDQINSLDLTHVGKYIFNYTCKSPAGGEEIIERTVYVKDTLPPVISLHCPRIRTFDSERTDNDECSTVDLATESLNLTGDAVVSVADAGEHFVEMVVNNENVIGWGTVQCVKDGDASSDCRYSIDNIKFYDGVTTMDVGEVLVSNPGEYLITYKAEDAAGNVATASSVVIIEESATGLGCTYPNAINYDSNATSDNGLCEFEGLLYDLNSDGNYDVLDIIVLVQFILNSDADPGGDGRVQISNINDDNSLDVLDVVILSQVVLYEDDPF